MKLLVLVLYFLCFYNKTSAQFACPPNIDFENNSFSNWQCFQGTTKDNGAKNQINLVASQPLSTRHEIMSSKTQKDKYGNFPVVCPYGGNYSVRLGNDNSGAEAEGISYTFTIPGDVDTFTFTYFYAVVFEDPGHPEPAQPRFYVTAYEVATGKIISCAAFDYVSTSSLPGFYKSRINSGVLYKDWSPVSLQFAGLMGKEVRLEFKNADCAYGAHFGYAYLDVASGCKNILATAPYCIQTNSLTLNAPYGFKSYTWYDSSYTTVLGTSQNLTLSPPPAYAGTFFVDVEPYPGFGCRDTFQAVAKPLSIPPIADADTDYYFCLNQANAVVNVYADSGNVIIWYKEDTTVVGSELPPVIPTNKVGDYVYYISQKQLFGCEGFKRKIVVHVVDFNNSLIQVNSASQCLVGNSVQFTSNASIKNGLTYNWDFGDNNSIIKNSDSTVTYVYKTSGSYNVVLRANYADKCTAIKSTIVNIEPSPIAGFLSTAPICESQTPIVLTDNSTIASYNSKISKWRWDIDGKIDTLRNPAAFIQNSAKPLIVKLIAISDVGCKSDTLTRVLQVQNKPKTKFGINNNLLCSDESINISDSSYFNNASNVELINKWNWSIDGITNFSTKNIAPVFTYGTHKIKLNVESNFGCKSDDKDTTIFVFQKPFSQLSLNDSCVFKAIYLNVRDSFNLVNEWYWNFGSGLTKQSNSIAKSYYKKGTYPFYIIGKTKDNCSDTLYKDLVIYDNIAFAGNDTIVAFDEPLYLDAGGYPNQKYLWTPNIGLNSDTIRNPIALNTVNMYYYLHSITQEGCIKDSKIFVKRYAGPALYIPTGFSPNGDKLNDILHVFPVGIKKFIHFSVFNRWGNLIFRTTDYKTGWDGKFRGQALGSDTFVVVAEAIDYMNKPLLYKGTVTLIK